MGWDNVFKIPFLDILKFLLKIVSSASSSYIFQEGGVTMHQNQLDFIRTCFRIGCNNQCSECFYAHPQAPTFPATSYFSFPQHSKHSVPSKAACSRSTLTFLRALYPVPAVTHFGPPASCHFLKDG